MTSPTESTSTARKVANVSRRGLFGATIAGAATVAGVTAGIGIPAAFGGIREALAAPSTTSKPGSSGVKLRWLGNNGWEISFDGKTILIDPWVTRFKTGTYTKAGADPNTPISSDRKLIDQYIGAKADHILVTHGHYDHMPDVPYIALKTGATVFGTESHCNMLRALSAPPDQLSMVKGGEYMQFDGYTIHVLRSLHSLVGERVQVPFPGTRPGGVPSRPKVIADLVEGDTLAYQITVGEKLRILNFGAANFDAQSVEGLRPDVVMVQPGGATVHQYVPRLLKLLDHPRYVFPTHWDDFDLPLSAPAKDWGGLPALEAAVKKDSPDTKFVRLEHLQTFTI